VINWFNQRYTKFVESNPSGVDRMIIFFDEVNCNSNLSGVLKEILIDRIICGAVIDGRVMVMVACNPKIALKQDSNG
jgi:hypothetical protein